ncbi:hypothetical protein Angca_003856, partial [Angiostrongylus cantonensis]
CLDGTISSDFFPALARAQNIYVDSKELLRNNGEHSAAVEIMEEMSQTLEKAYEVLYRSVQSKCLMKILCIRFLKRIVSF